MARQTCFTLSGVVAYFLRASTMAEAHSRVEKRRWPSRLSLVMLLMARLRCEMLSAVLELLKAATNSEANIRWPSGFTAMIDWMALLTIEIVSEYFLRALKMAEAHSGVEKRRW